MVHFHQVDKKEDLPDFEGYDDVTIKRSILFKEYLNQIYERAKLIRSGKVKLKDDNMLKITKHEADGRTYTNVKKLVDDEVTQEVMRLIGTNEVSEYAYKQGDIE